LEEFKMAYNNLKEYWKWRRAKEAEEKEFRVLGIDENAISEIHDFDRIMFNSNERFYKRLNDVGNFYEEIIPDKRQQEITSLEQLLDEIENPAMYKILKKANELTLRIILMRVRGYSVADISGILHISKTAIYSRIETVRNKLKNVI